MDGDVVSKAEGIAVGKIKGKRERRRAARQNTWYGSRFGAFGTLWVAVQFRRWAAMDVQC